MADTLKTSAEDRRSYSTPDQHAKLLRSTLRTVEAEPDLSYETPTVIDAAERLADALQARLDHSARTGGP